MVSMRFQQSNHLQCKISTQDKVENWERYFEGDSSNSKPILIIAKHNIKMIYLQQITLGNSKFDWKMRRVRKSKIQIMFKETFGPF